MPVPASQERERPEDKIAGNTVRCNDQTTGLNGILNQDLAMHRTGESGHKFRFCHARINLLMPPDISQPSPGQDAGLLRKAEFSCDDPPFSDQFKFFRHRPALIHSHRREQEFFSADCFQEGDTFKVVNTLCFFQCLQGCVGG